MSYVDFITPAIKLANEAASLDEAQNYKDAYPKYLNSIDYFVTAIKHYKNDPTKQDILREKAIALIERAEMLKNHLDKATEATQAAQSKKETRKVEKETNSEKSEFMGALETAIIKEKPNVKWNDVAGLEGAKDALKEAVILPTRFPQLFTDKRTPWQGILLYGPPGTGKSYLAKAVATEAKGTFFSISSSDLMSRYQGESEKLVRTLFEMSREQKPAIIFIDEIDSLCSERSDGENDSTRRVKTEFLVQMQGVGKDPTGVLILAATNTPWSLDPAIRRRFERRVYIPLPELQARKSMFKLHIGKTPCNLTNKDFDELAKLTEGYSGSDISILVRNALFEPIRTCQVATHFKKVSGPDPTNPADIVDDLYCPCSPDDPNAIEISMNDLEEQGLASKLFVPPVTRLDFLRALKTARPSVSVDDLGDYVKFTQDFGQEG